MRSLPDLLGTTQGRRFLEERGVFVDAGDFLESMAAPARDALVSIAGLPRDTHLVFTGQQVQTDYSSTVTAKFRTLSALDELDERVTPILLPMDTDRSGASKKWGTTLVWPGEPPQSIRLASYRYSDIETRYVPLDRSRLEQVLATVDRWLDEIPENLRERARERWSRVSPRLLEVSTLADANLVLTEWLLKECLGFEPRTFLVSEMVERGLLTGTMNQVIADIDATIAVFNEQVDALAATDIDARVHALDEEYLPLRYSCPDDGLRRTLVHERRGADHFAVATCRCGKTYSFHLGSRTLSIDELAAAGRWSVDVTLPVYVNDLVSGAVGGVSSCLYGLVLNHVIEKTLGTTAVPMLVPAELEASSSDGPGVDSLFYECLTN